MREAQNITAQVSCYSGTAYAEKPRFFRYAGERLAVAEVLAAWLAPDGKHFRVQTANESIFELIYEPADDRWFIFAR